MGGQASAQGPPGRNPCHRKGEQGRAGGSAKEEAPERVKKEAHIGRYSASQRWVWALVGWARVQATPLLAKDVRRCWVHAGSARGGVEACNRMVGLAHVTTAVAVNNLARTVACTANSRRERKRGWKKSSQLRKQLTKRRCRMNGWRTSPSHFRFLAKTRQLWTQPSSAQRELRSRRLNRALRWTLTNAARKVDIPPHAGGVDVGAVRHLRCPYPCQHPSDASQGEVGSRRRLRCPS